MTKSTALNQKQTFQQMIAKADSDLAALRAEEQEARRNLARAEQEQQTLSQRATARADQLQAARAEVQRLQEAVQKQQASVSIAEGTGAHSDLIHTLQGLERQAQKAEQELTKVQDQGTKVEQADASRRAVAEATAKRETIALARQAEKAASISEARQRAMIALGQAEYEEVMALVALLQNHVAAKQEQLRQAEQEFEQKLQVGIDHLATWPELRSQVKMLQVHRDPVTDMLETFASLLDILIEKGPAVFIDSMFIQNLLGRFATLETVLSVDERYVAAGLRGADVETLRERRGQVEKLLTGYRESQRQASPVGSSGGRKQRW